MVSTCVLSCPGLPAAFTSAAKAFAKRSAITDLGVLNLGTKQHVSTWRLVVGRFAFAKKQHLKAGCGFENCRVNGLARCFFAAHHGDEGCPDRAEITQSQKSWLCGPLWQPKISRFWRGLKHSPLSFANSEA